MNLGVEIAVKVTVLSLSDLVFYPFGNVVRGGDDIFVFSTFGWRIDWSYKI
jgi:hypothetical protein